MALSERPMLLTRYPNSHYLEALCIEPSIRYMCNQLEWDEYTKPKKVTYRNPTLELLSSLTYLPYRGRGFKKILITFRLFGHEYTFNHREFVNLLGFQFGPVVVVEVPYDWSMQDAMDTFWGVITTEGNPGLTTQFSTCIYNPTLRYFQMLLA